MKAIFEVAKATLLGVSVTVITVAYLVGCLIASPLVIYDMRKDKRYDEDLI